MIPVGVPLGMEMEIEGFALVIKVNGRVVCSLPLSRIAESIRDLERRGLV